MPDDQNRALLNHYIEQMTGQKLAGTAVSLCDIRKEPKEVFSGTLYLAEDRLFVITCAHAVPANANGKIWLIRKQGQYLSEGIPAAINTYRPSGERPDIALVEFDPRILTDYLKGYSPIGPEDIGELDYSVPSHEIVVLVGNPAEDTNYLKLKGEIIKTHISFLKHETVPPDKWPEPMRDSAPNDRLIDIYLQSIKKDDTSEKAKDWYYTNPQGLSGGGVWALTITPGALLTPANFRLVGVQSAWNWKAGFLRAVRVETLRSFTPAVWDRK